MCVEELHSLIYMCSWLHSLHKKKEKGKRNTNEVLVENLQFLAHSPDCLKLASNWGNRVDDSG